ncbi:MAG: penicillin-binding protein 2 [Parcubacteria group bacterium]|nr:penicillin-binding protein 2 [Parcubacteria group bacterium]
MFPLFKKHHRSSKTELLEVDEIFFDQHQLSSRALKWSDRLESPVAPSRLKYLGYALTAVLAIVGLRGLYLVLFKNNYYAAKAQANYVKEIWERPRRGIIYDGNGQALVGNVSAFNLVAIPAELPRDRALQEKLIEKIARLLNEDRSQVIEAFRNIDRFSFRPVLLLEDLSHQELLAFKSQAGELPGLRLEENFKRAYGQATDAQRPRPDFYSHVLGYTGRVSQNDLKKNPDYLLTDIIGKAGLEAQYENILRGKAGATFLETGARGKTERVIGSTKSKPGDNLTLFLDAGLQEKLSSVMSQIVLSRGLTKAAAVAIDPSSGGVLALQSLPLFSGNVFSSRINPEEYHRIFEDANQPLFNRAVSGLYPPGSTIKPFLGIAALQEKIVDDKTTILDTGSITVAGQEFRGWKPLGVVDIYSAISMSSNIFFYTVGGGYGNIAGLGPKKIADYLSRFGFTALTGIDLPGERSGSVPTPDWKKQTYRESWFAGDTYNMSIGQGYVQFTPLGLAMATAAIANNGVLLKPRLVKSVSAAGGTVLTRTEPEIVRKNFVDPHSLAIIREAMHQTVTKGAAGSLAGLPGSAAGKTGTAETGLGENTHAWFTAFAPFEDPKIVLTVLVENAGIGSQVAVPIAKEVMEWYLAR